MINLIPPEAKVVVVKEYWLRVAVSCLILLGVVSCMIAIMQIPAYVLVSSVESTLADQIEAIKSKQQTFQDLTTKTKEANQLISAVAVKEDDKKRFSEYINQLDTIAADGVLLTKFTLQTADGVIDSIDIIGVADTRTDLAEFRQALEDHPEYTGVELPISNLARESNITFTLSLAVVPLES